MFVARKVVRFFEDKHQGKETELYADLLAHLIKNKFKQDGKLVLNIAERGNTTRNTVLEKALDIAKERAARTLPKDQLTRPVVFNVQNHLTEPLLNIADYLCWTVQRVFERGETRYYDFMRSKITSVVDLYDKDNYRNYKNYYNATSKPLTAKNQLIVSQKSPPST